MLDSSTPQQEQPELAKSALTAALTIALLTLVQNSEIKLSIEKKHFSIAWIQEQGDCY